MSNETIKELDTNALKLALFISPGKKYSNTYFRITLKLTTKKDNFIIPKRKEFFNGNKRIKKILEFFTKFSK